MPAPSGLGFGRGVELEARLILSATGEWPLRADSRIIPYTLHMAKHFSVDARAMLTWGRESIKDHTTAVLELVKNSYDANATIVEVQINSTLYARGGPHIRVSDNGVGMSAVDVEKYWLRLGYSPKREERFTARGRRKTGEKGVGRISADRLGSILELRSQARNHEATGLRVDWREFEEPGRDIQSVPVTELDTFDFTVPRPSKRDPKTGGFASSPDGVANSKTQTGTELLICDLRQSWDTDDVQELRRLLSLLTPPFEDVDEFQIRLGTDVDPTSSGVVTSPLIASAAIEGHFSLLPDGNVEIRLVHRAGGSTRRRVEKKSRLPFEQFVHPRVKSNSNEAPTMSAKRLGPVTAQLLFYPQKAETVRGLDLDLSELREFLRTNAGVRVYRDGIRVPPFGDSGKPEGDWLALGDRKARNPAGPNRPNFRVSPYQLVGAVMIGRDSNPELIDTSGREGLVASEALSVLKSFIIGCLTRLETRYHELFKESQQDSRQPLPSPRDTVGELKVQLTELADTIRRAEVQLPAPANKEMERVVEQLATTTDKLKRAERTFEELGSQAATSRTLATIGISATTTSCSHLMPAHSKSRQQLSPASMWRNGSCSTGVSWYCNAGCISACCAWQSSRRGATLFLRVFPETTFVKPSECSRPSAPSRHKSSAPAHMRTSRPNDLPTASQTLRPRQAGHANGCEMAASHRPIQSPVDRP